jgi:hypothetical protein
MTGIAPSLTFAIDPPMNLPSHMRELSPSGLSRHGPFDYGWNIG